MRVHTETFFDPKKILKQVVDCRALRNLITAFEGHCEFWSTFNSVLWEIVLITEYMLIRKKNENKCINHISQKVIKNLIILSTGEQNKGIKKDKSKN